MSADLELRAALPADLPAILAFDCSAAADQRRRVFIDAAFYGGWITVAVREHTIVGFAATHRHFFSRPFLALLIVDHAQRRRGIARRLVQDALERCGELWTSTNTSNVAAQRLFESLAFTRAGTIDGLDPGDPELIYRRACD